MVVCGQVVVYLDTIRFLIEVTKAQRAPRRRLRVEYRTVIRHIFNSRVDAFDGAYHLLGKPFEHHMAVDVPVFPIALTEGKIGLPGSCRRICLVERFESHSPQKIDPLDLLVF
ncbi:hypothetical protein D3C86_1842460 [compost metagenome]